MDRKLDGMYFRVERNGHWVNVCLSDMTNEERAKALEGKDKQFLQTVIDRLCNTIQEIGDLCDLARD